MKTVFATAVIAAIGFALDPFTGCWSDPNHPDGYRIIKMNEGQLDKQGATVGTVSGSDTGKT